tara:strand:- start:54 stop:278 length:225 start_codon:yes stop_codon:yes gene_type:complete
MKTIKLTKKQFDIFRSIFIEGLHSRQNTFEDELDYEWLGDEQIGEPRCTKQQLKEINNEKRIIERIEKKLNLKS